MAKGLSKSEFDKKVVQSDKPALVDFYAAWCGPCQIMAPVIDELAKEIKGKAHIFKVNVDKESDLANQFQILSIPTYLIFKGGKIINQFTGVTKKGDLLKALE